jgi:hypothetical protein
MKPGGSSFRDAMAIGAGDSPEHRKLLRAIQKADGDRERAVKNVCRLYSVKGFGALPLPVQFVLRNVLP